MTTDARQELIRKKAYDLFVKRGQVPGHEMEDWLAAEKIVDRELQDSKGLPRTETSKGPSRPAVSPIRATSKASSFKRV